MRKEITREALMKSMEDSVLRMSALARIYREILEKGASETGSLTEFSSSKMKYAKKEILEESLELKELIAAFSHRIGK
jgi:hypothetical protein